MTKKLVSHNEALREPAWRGFDWDAITPRCVLCGQQSGQLNKADTCPACQDVTPTAEPAMKAAPARGSTSPNASYVDRLRALGVPTREVKEWALGQGLITQIARGLPSADVVDAYAAAHPTEGDES